MTIQLLVFAFGIPTAFIFLNLVSFVISKKLESSLARDFEEITKDWVKFCQNGIPVPADYKRIEGPFTGEPVLVQPLLQKQGLAPSKAL